ncbi:MAG: site-2 protease family protein [Promethearchaeota archaeon]
MKIGTIRGIDIKLHFSTLAIIALVGFYAGYFYLDLVPTASILELIVVGFFNGIIILFSILLHELMHSLAAKSYGINVPEIELYIFGGVSKIESEPPNAKSEAIIAGVGPLSSLLLGLSFFIASLFGDALPSMLTVSFLYSGITNMGLALFNLIPAFPMDGGKVLRAFIWSRKNDFLRATMISSRIGRVFGYGFIFFGLYQVFFFGLINGIWLILIGSFLNNSARRSYIETLNDYRLSRIHVKAMLNPGKLTIPHDMIISDAIREYFIPHDKPYFPVTIDGEIIGIIHIDDIKKLSVEERAFKTIGKLTRSISNFPTITGDKTGMDVVKAMRTMGDYPHLVVVREGDDEHILGFIGRKELISSLRFWRMHEQVA